MKLLEKIKEKRLVAKSSDEREVVVSVPDIKEYLVREYNRAGKARENLKSAKDEINSYKIKFTNAAITKAEITAEIVEELKADLIAEINNHKGNLSKKIVCDIITAYQKGRFNEFV